jgi:hypothetical protein
MTRLGTTNRYGFRSRLRLTRTQTASGGAPAAITVKDLLYTSYPDATLEHGGYIEVQHSPGYVPTFESSDASKATVSSTGLLTKVGSGGTVEITCRVGGIEARHRVSLFTQVNATQVYQGFAAGSLLKHTNDTVDGLIGGKTPATAKAVFDAQAPYIRNADCWAASFDLTGISPRNSQLGNRLAGVAVTPRHVLFARHYQPEVGMTLDFVTADSQVVTRTIAAKASLSGAAADWSTDVTVARLDSDLPGAIKPYRVLPAEIAGYLPGLDKGVPVLCLDQEKKALIYEWRGYQLGAARYSWPQTYQRSQFCEALLSGDSGNPIFVPIGGELVLLGLCSAAGMLVVGPAIQTQLAAINALITSLGSSGGYTLTTANLASFPNYG